MITRKITLGLVLVPSYHMQKGNLHRDSYEIKGRRLLGALPGSSCRVLLKSVTLYRPNLYKQRIATNT